MPSEPPKDYLRRLNAGAYQGLACVHWSMTIEDRRHGWLTPAFYSSWREIHLHTLDRYKLACPAFCLMPDHLHLLWIGLAPESDQRKAAKFFREQMNRLLKEAGGELKTHVSSYGKRETEQGLKTDVFSYEKNEKGGKREVKVETDVPDYRLQLQGYDHVLTAEERQRDAFARVAFYIFENPVRKGLVKFWSDYAFSGSQVVGYPTLNVGDTDYWETFWKIYERIVVAENRS